MTRNREVDLMRLKQHLKALKLPTIQAECEKLARECRPRRSTTWASCSSSASWS